MARDILAVLQRDYPQRGRTERIYSRKQIEQAFLETFELIGGVQRLTLWAHREENYHEFLKLMMRLAPKEMLREVGTVLEYRSNVPSSPLAQRGRPSDDISEGEIVED
jgi:hypothetical protein